MGLRPRADPNARRSSCGCRCGRAFVATTARQTLAALRREQGRNAAFTRCASRHPTPRTTRREACPVARCSRISFSAGGAMTASPLCFARSMLPRVVNPKPRCSLEQTTLSVLSSEVRALENGLQTARSSLCGVRSLMKNAHAHHRAADRPAPPAGRSTPRLASQQELGLLPERRRRAHRRHPADPSPDGPDMRPASAQRVQEPMIEC